MGELRTLLMSRNVPFSDETKQVCTYYSSFTGSCLTHDTQVARKGVGSDVLKVTNFYTKNKLGKQEEVKVGNSGLTFTVVLEDTISQKIAVVKELITLVSAMPAGDTEKYVRAWAKVRIEREEARRDAYEAAQKAEEDKYMAALREQERTEAEKQMLRWYVLIGVGAALVTLLVAGLALAVIAIERHTRAIVTMKAQTE